MPPPNRMADRPHAPAARTAPAALLLGAVAVFLSLCAWAWSFTMDDAYISWRYAKHLGDGLGPVWNLSDLYPVVEGYTSFLYVWTLGALRAVTRADVPLLGKSLGVASSLTVLWLAFRASRRAGLSPAATAVALSVFALPYAIVHSVSGMETAFYMLWCWLCPMAALRLLEAPGAARCALFVLFGLGGTLTRPDFAANFLAVSAWVFWREPRVRSSLLLAGVALYALPGLAVTAWRWEFYGDVVPNTVHVKQRSGIDKWGLFYVLRFGAYCVLPYLLVAVSGWRALWRDHRDLLVIVGLCVAIPCLYYSTTYPMMGWWYRFQLPQLPLVAFLAAVGWNARDRSAPLPLRWAPGLGAAAGLLLAIGHLPGVFEHVPYRRADELRFHEVARRLQPFAAPDRWLNYYDVGTIPYASDWNTVDVVGLNTHRRDLEHDCIMKTDVVLRSESSEPFPPRHDISNPCPDVYVQIADLPFVDQPPAKYRYMRVFARSDVDYADALRESLLADWPEPYHPPVGFIHWYTKRFGLWLGR